ncbi:cobalt-precorrin-6A reductase [Tropicimonas sp. IMCC34043]|uniref:cobalt-precorrin-6A reductase n=1 Tax=Tropicimonas sp. IMCC34043 TaxID=2248760 RepID=UPI000E279963|nr:cobalt-precorrin-6A reductase [Tropicimonas sp. IMCC34043]
MKRVLILGGTGEARALSHRLDDLADLTVALAGVTRTPAAYGGRLRIGGFGGAEGLARWLETERTDVLVDATHPFAARISAHAQAAAARAGCLLLRLERPEWHPAPGEHWQVVADLAAALAALPPGARPFLATGAGSVAALAARPDLGAVLRSIEPVPDLPARITHLRARPPFTVAEETAMLRDHAVTHLVLRNSGGAAGRTKLAAAAALGLPVLMIGRPPLPEGVECLPTVDATRRRILGLPALDTPKPPAP